MVQLLCQLRPEEDTQAGELSVEDVWKHFVLTTGLHNRLMIDYCCEGQHGDQRSQEIRDCTLFEAIDRFSIP